MSPQAVFPDAPNVTRVALPWSLAPERAALLVRDDPRPFAMIGAWAGGGALIGSAPVRVARTDEDPFALLDERPVSPGSEPPQDVEDRPVGGGWFGAFPYGLVRALEPVGAQPPTPEPAPPYLLAYYDHLLRLDHDGRWWFEALGTGQRADALKDRLRVLSARAADAPRPRPFSTESWRATPSAAGHSLAVAACRERIYAGDLFQANICVRLESRLSGTALDLFVAAYRALRPDRAAFLSGPGRSIASLSPELFLERRGRRVRSAPIKGTRPHPSDPHLAAAERDALLSSDKDRAENVMIVDLVRNDLGRVCQPGSIRVDALCEARPHTGVWHLVSEVSGVLRDEVRDGELVRAAFPPGSVSGAPKVAAVNVIAELESSARGIYTGAIGFASPSAGLELSVAIRTFEFVGDRAWLGVGGGIVADSDPSAEAAECVTKAEPLLAAIGATLAPQPPESRAPPPGPRRLGPVPVPRPDPAAGVFETLLVEDGHPVCLRRHLNRLAVSVGTLYRSSLPSELAEEMIHAASGVDRARMRVDAVPGTAGIETRIELAELPARTRPTRLVVEAVPGGLGAHKWADRRLIAALGAAAGGEPLICDLDGFVLEVSRANVFIVESDGRIVTPPADGRILPGVTRARVLELGAELGLSVHVEPISLDRLNGARELFLTGSLSGVEPAELGAIAPGPRPITTRLAGALEAAPPPVAA